jgi:hypothetical protein
MTAEPDDGTEEIEYTVEWRIDVTAGDPLTAAQYAQRIMQDPDSTATVFEVTPMDGGVTETIDLIKEES